MALEQGKVDAREHIGQRFTRHLRKDTADVARYRACETNKKKATFRMQWLQDVVEAEKSPVKEEKKSGHLLDPGVHCREVWLSIRPQDCHRSRDSVLQGMRQDGRAMVETGRYGGSDAFPKHKDRTQRVVHGGLDEVQETTVDPSKEEMELDGDSLPQSPAPT